MVVVVGALLLAASPLVFLGALELLPRHGDATGTIGDALLLGLGCALGGLALGAGALVVLVVRRGRHRRHTRR